MGTDNRSREIAAEISLLFVMLIWGANYPLAKYALGGMNTFVFNAIRFAVAAIVLLLFFLLRSEWKPVQKGDWGKLIRAGFVGNVIYQMAFIIGLSLTTAGNSAVLLSTSPLWTVFLNARMHKEKIRPLTWAGMAISLLGIILIIAGSGKKIALGGNELIGDIIILCAAILWALNTNLQKPLLVHYSPAQLSLVMIAIGSLGLSVVALPAVVTFDWAALDWTYYVAAIASGAFSIGIANLVWSRGVKRLGPSRTSNFNNLVPVIALMISYFTLHEQLLPIQFVGAGITVIGIWIARR